VIEMADLLTNFDLSGGYCKCHNVLDFRVGPEGDIALTKDDQQAMRQRFLIYLATPKGERLDPTVGSCIHDFIHEINAPKNTRRLELFIKDDLDKQFPELKTRAIRCQPSTYLDGEMEIRVILADDNLHFIFSPDDIMTLSSTISELLFYTT
jgi:hypothetical protein